MAASPCARGTLAAVFVVAVLGPRAAAAEANEPPTVRASSEPSASRDAPAKEADDDLRVGVLGGVGFPQPLSVEAVVGLNRTFMVGAEVGFLPEVSVQSVKTRLWAAAADFRVYPFRGAFFVGLRGGYQSLSVDATVSAANVGSYTDSVGMGTWFVNPRVGFLWVWKPFAIGIDAGIQIPIATNFQRSSLLAIAAPDVDARVTSITDILGKTPIPTVDLLRIGLVF